VPELPTPVAPRLRFVEAVPGNATSEELVPRARAPVRTRKLIPLGAVVLMKGLLASALFARIYGICERYPKAFHLKCTTQRSSVYGDKLRCQQRAAPANLK